MTRSDARPLLTVDFRACIVVVFVIRVRSSGVVFSILTETAKLLMFFVEVKMRKILAVLSIAGLALMACGGGGASSPEDAVNGMFDAMKSGDIDAMAQYLPEDERSEITEMSDEEKEMAQGMLAMLSAMEYEIKGTEIDGDVAVVTIEITFMGETEEEDVELTQENGTWVVTSGGMF